MKVKKKSGGYLVLSESQVVGEGIPNQVKLLPLGTVKSRKGPFVVDQIAFKEMVNYFNERAIDIVGDYEHQTLDGVIAPASGWAKQLHLKEDGVYADVEWTKKAKAFLESKEYRYISPVVFRRKSDGRAVVLHSFALTNTPAIDGMEPIINSLDFEYEGGTDNMEFLKQLAKLLGLSEESTEAQILEAVMALVKNAPPEEVVANKQVLDLLSLKEDATTYMVVEAIKGMSGTSTDLIGQVVALKAEVDKLSKKAQEKDSDDLVQMALSAGKITPKMKEWAEELALKDPSAFKSYVENAPQIVPMDELNITGDKKKTATDTEMSVNNMLGVSDEDLEKYGGDD